MTADELLLKLVLKLGRTGRPDVTPHAALLVNVGGRPDAWRVTHKAVGGPGINLPSAKILTTCAKGLGPAEFLGNSCLVLNYLPSDWCLGLAWLLKVKYVLYFTATGAAALRTSTDALDVNGFPVWTMSTWNWNCTFSAATLNFEYPADRERRPSRALIEQKATIKAIVDSLDSATSIAARDFNGVQISAVPPVQPGQGFVPMRGNAFRDDLLIRTALALVNKTWKHGGGRSEGLAGHNIGAVAVGAGDKILGWAVNVSEVSRCFHAESMLVNNLVSSRVDVRGLRLYATLEPCQMCAGMITTLCPNAEVIYGMADSKIKFSSLARNKNNCMQRLSNTLVDYNETIPSLLDRLKTTLRFDNTTGFLDAPRAARRAFSSAATGLARTSTSINRFHTNVEEALESREDDPDARRRAIALLDVRSAYTAPNISRNLQGLDLANGGFLRRGDVFPQLQWVGTNWRIHLPFVQYLTDVLASIALNRA